MLILTRKPGESLYIGDNVKITIVEIKGNQIRVGIDAPSELRIYREEIYLQILEENKKAAEAVMSGGALEELSGSWKGVKGGKLAEPKVQRGVRAPAPTPTRTQPEPKIFVKRKKQRHEGEEEEDQGSPNGEREQES